MSNIFKKGVPPNESAEYMIGKQLRERLDASDSPLSARLAEALDQLAAEQAAEETEQPPADKQRA